MKNILLVMFIVIILLAGCANDVVINVEPATNETSIAPSFAIQVSSPIVKAIEENNTNVEIQFETNNTTKQISKFVLPSNYFGNTNAIHPRSPITCTSDDEGNLYYIDGAIVWKLTGIGNKKELITNSEIAETFNFREAKSVFTFLTGTIFANKNLYIIVFVEFEDMQTGLFVVNLLNNDILDVEIQNICCSYNNNILVNMDYNENTDTYDYMLYNLKEDRSFAINSEILSSGEIIKDILFSTDSYVILSVSNFNEDDVSDKIIIIDTKLDTKSVTIPVDMISTSMPVILDCREDSVVFFDSGTSSINELDLALGELVSKVQFSQETTFVGYENSTSKIYLKQGRNYYHSKDNLFDGTHEYSKDCISEDELDNAKEVYFEFDFTTNNYKILNIVNTTEYFPNKYTCLYSMKDYKLGNHILTYYNSDGDTIIGYSSFSSIFILGEEVDYSAWKD